MKAYETRKLNFQLVPKTSWYANLRSILANWPEISAKVREGGFCSICGAKTDDLHAHEVWEYDDTSHTQKLKEVAPVCGSCHNAIHIGHAQVKGTQHFALRQYAEVNRLSPDEIQADLDEAADVWIERSRHDWTIDEKQIKEKVFEQTGIKCKSYPSNGRYYAKVLFEEKENAKKQGAKWDPDRKMWYFLSKEAQDNWLNRAI